MSWYVHNYIKAINIVKSVFIFDHKIDLKAGETLVFSTFYFSGTGNTKWAAGQFCDIVNSSGNNANMYSIDANDELTDDMIKAILSATDFIGFANPIYGADIPLIMKGFIRRLTEILKKEKTDSMPAYFINTFGYINAFGPFAANKLFDKDCLRLMAHVNIRMCNNISTYRIKSDSINPEVLSKRRAQAINKLKILRNRLLSGKNTLKG